MSQMNSATSSGALTTIGASTAIVSAGPGSPIASGTLCGVTLTPAAAAATLTIKDGNGLVLEQLSMPAGQSFIVDYAVGTQFVNGLFYTLTGTGATAVARFYIG